MDRMRIWWCFVWDWTVDHWKILGSVATFGLVGRFVKWLYDIRLSIEQRKEVKARNDEREKQEKCDEIRKFYCDQFWRVKQSGVVIRDLNHLVELVPLRNPDEEALRLEAYGLVLHGRYRGGISIIEQKRAKSKYLD